MPEYLIVGLQCFQVGVFEREWEREIVELTAESDQEAIQRLKDCTYLTKARLFKRINQQSINELSDKVLVGPISREVR